jgi:hypothetical protein
MTQITSYRQAEYIAEKARNIAKGKPLGPQHWRMFKDGDEFTFYYLSTMVARILPNNTLRLVSDGGHFVHLPNGALYSIHKVLPVSLVNRSKGHYRLHIAQHGEAVPSIPRDELGVTDWDAWRKGGVRFYDGLTIDLATRTAVSYAEPTMEVDAAARKLWLSQLKTLKRHLKTIAKLGGFTARMESLDPSVRRWELVRLMHRPEDIDLAVAALRGDITEEFLGRLTHDLALHHYFLPDIAEQLRLIDKFFTTYSATLRLALGVITPK